LEHAGAIDMLEPVSHAHLDLAAGAIMRGDFDAATGSIAAARALGDSHALAWRHRIRGDLYTAHVALATGRSEDALALGEAVATAGSKVGVERYDTMALLLVAHARQVLGLPVDLGRVEALLDALGRLAGLEAWRLTADAAATFGVDRWWQLAEQRVGALARAAGPYAEALGRAAAARLDKTSSSRHSG
jgi:hypothetical protein